MNTSLSIKSAPLFIYGPQGCGKTRNASALAAHFGKSNIVDDFQDHPDTVTLTERDLVLTNCQSELTHVNQITFHDAMAQAGLTFALSLKNITPPRIGQYWQDEGGLYTGIMRGENGQPDYHLITPIDPLASIDSIAWATKLTNQLGASSEVDGLANTNNLCASSIDYPAARWATSLKIEGHNDFYLPARHELRLMYINLPNAFNTDDWYWSSTQYAYNTDYAWMQYFYDGNQLDYRKSNKYRARAVRRILIIQ